MNKKKILTTTICIAIWIFLWFIAAFFIDKKIFLPGPVDTLKAFCSLAVTKEFYQSVLVSLSGILKGFLIGMGVGILFASLACRFSFLESFFSVPIRVIKAVPVASFVILALLWINSKNLSILISSFMVLPVVYTGLLSALKNTDRKMLDFAVVFKLSPLKKIRYVYIPSAIHPLTASCSVAMGFAWKSGIAAEIIGLIKNSIGNELYKAKLYLETPKLFAWTAAIVLISFLCEKLITLILTCIGKALGGIYNE